MKNITPKKKEKIEFKINKLLGSLRIPQSTRVGGPMSAEKGKHVKYNRNKQKKWRKEQNI